MWASREVMQYAYTKGGGGGRGFGRRSTAQLRRPIVAVHRLTDQPCNRKWTAGGPEKNGPAKRTAGSHLPVMPKKLISP